MAIKHFHKGFPVWVENVYEEKSSQYRASLLPQNYCTRPTWIPATVYSVDNANRTVEVRTTFSPSKTVHLTTDKIWARNNTRKPLEDMVYFHHLHEPAIVNNIMVRYLSQQIYTRAGEILIVMNPYKLCRDKDGISIYDEMYMRKYRVKSEGTRSGGNPPHIFEVANRAFIRLREDGKPQSIVISGESGAGKTETTKQIMQFVANISSSSGQSGVVPNEAKERSAARRRSTRRRGSLGGPANKFEVSDKAVIERQLLQSNPILESFGNCKTMRNNNSSRFGKYLKIFFEDGKIVGGSITNYLLEKSRVFTQLSGERSYHIFYQILRGADEDYTSGMYLRSPDQYRILSKSRSHDVRDAYMGGEGSSDEADFFAVKNAMSVCGFSDEAVKDTFRIVAAVLQLGNVRFDDVEDGNVSSGRRAVGVTQAASKDFDAACKNLGLTPDSLSEAFRTRHLTVGGNTQVLAVDAKSADEAVVALAGTLYTWLFSAIVRMVNEGIRKSVETELGFKPDLNSTKFIGILDIFGFEVFDTQNGFEQLLINYANERLHNFFIQYVFKLEEKKYQEEGIDYSNIEFQDNQAVIDLISKKPDGIFQQMSSAGVFGKLTDVKLLEKMAQAFAKKNSQVKDPSLQLFKKKGPRYPNKFIVCHSANNVEYTIDGFLKKNKDHLLGHLMECVETSTMPLMAQLLGSKKGKSSEKRTTLTGASVMLSLRFGSQIGSLMKTMRATNPLFVRCIKSNEVKRPFFFDSAKVFHQLRYLGVLESIRIRHEGYSYQESFKAFYEYFVVVAQTNPEQGFVLVPEAGADYRPLAEKLGTLMWSWIKEEEFPKSKLKDHFQLGQTRVFIRKKLAQGLEALRGRLLIDMEIAANKILAAYNGFRVRKRMKVFKTSLVRCQLAFRGRFYREVWVRRQHSIKTLQWFVRGYLLRKRFNGTVKPAICILQRFIRKTHDRLRWLRIRRGLRILHRLSRGFIVRRHVMKMLEAVKRLQRGIRGFLARNRMYWSKVKAVLFMQSLWRAYQARQQREDIVDFLALKRKNRRVKICVRRLQGFWKSVLVYRRFQSLKQGAIALQKWCNARLARFRFKSIRRNTRFLQRVARGMLARLRARRLRTANLLADEMWRIKVVREREILQSAKMSHGIRDQSLQPSSSRIVGNGNRKRPTYHVGVLDVDVTSDINEVYPKGWSASFCELTETLAKSNRCIINVAMGAQHTMAVDSRGDIYSWGWGDMGQLGLGTYRQEKSPRVLHKFTQLLKNRSGSHGRVMSPHRSITQRVAVQAIGCGEDHSVVLADDGSVYTWGSNFRGQLGNGAGRQSSCHPKKVDSLRRPVIEISCGSYHNLCLLSSGSVAVWGSGEQLGLGVFMGNGDQHTPIILSALAKNRIRHVSSGPDYSMVVSHSGDLYSWGSNNTGQLGHGDKKARLIPCIVTSLQKDNQNGRVVAMSCGTLHALAQTSTGRLYAWGGNNNGQLGLGDTKTRLQPTRISKLGKHSVISISAGGRQSIALTEEQRMFAWGICGAVVHMQKTIMYDPDADNTVFESRVPKEIPFNMGVGRSPRDVHISRNSSMSVAWMLYHQRPVDAATAAHPLLARRTSIAMEAERMTQNAVRHRTGGAESRNKANVQDSKVDSNDASDPFSTASPKKTQKASPRKRNKMTSKDLDSLSAEQLKNLVLEMQNAIPDDQHNNSRNEDGIVLAGLRTFPGQLNAPQNALLSRTSGERNKKPLDKAKEKSWDSHFFNSDNVMKNRSRVSPPKSEHPYRRRMSAELSARTEMLLAYSKKLKAEKIDLSDRRRMLGARTNPIMVSDELAEQTLKADLARQHKKERREAQLKMKRLAREGSADKIIELFTPEQLVATSNDEMNVADIIQTRLANGKMPTLKIVKGKEGKRKNMFRDQPDHLAAFRREETNKVTIRHLVGPSGKMLMRRRENQSEAKIENASEAAKPRDVLESYRRNLSKLDNTVNADDNEDTSQGTGVDWKGRTEEMQARRRREIEQDILGSSGNQFYAAKMNSPQSKLASKKSMRTMSYIALEKEVADLRNQIFGDDN
jgi:myosin heavy subunit/alpha-tubulin suppressor-like RCC1 family protein